MEDLVSRISKQIGHLLLLAPAVMLSQVGDDIHRHGNLGTTDCPPSVTLNSTREQHKANWRSFSKLQYSQLLDI